MNIEKNKDIIAIENCVVELCKGMFDAAKEHILKIDEAQLKNDRKEKVAFVASRSKAIEEPPTKFDRIPPTQKKRLNCFLADNYICCYFLRHTINADIFRLIAKLIPDAFPLDKNWTFTKCHMAVWAYSADYEHLFSIGR